MPAWIHDLLSVPSLARSLLAALIIGFTNGCFSAYVVLRRGALVAGSLSHALLPGIVLGVMVAGKLTGWSSFLGALFAAVVVLVFLGNSRATIISALAIPTSIIAAFGVMWAEGGRGDGGWRT